MQTKKMSLANIQGKLSRAEMKNIMAGSTVPCNTIGGPVDFCRFAVPTMCPHLCMLVNLNAYLCC